MRKPWTRAMLRTGSDVPIRLLLVGLLIGAMVAGMPAPASTEEPSPWQRLVVAVHVHSTVSTGTLTLDELADEAEQVGVDAVVLSDNFSLRYEYGLFPLRGNLKARVGVPSVLDVGPVRYLEMVAEAQRRHPRVLLIPGVEVAPHYFWTGSVLTGDLTMHDAQRNLLVFGLPTSEDYLALPVTGNAAAYRYDWRTARDLLPGLLFIPAALVWRGASLRGARRWFAGGLAGLAVLLLGNAWPFQHPACSVYAEDCAYRPSQAVIDLVEARGGQVYWSLPEARDDHEYSVGPLGAVQVRTEPYPDALHETNGYSGFGGVYEDHHPMTDPGGRWDDLLNQYQTGMRSTWPVLISESGFHGPGADRKRLDRVQTVAWVRERTVPAVLEALAAGRHYAVLHDPTKFLLRLDAFQVQCEGRAKRAGLGDTLRADPGCRPTVTFAVSSSDGTTRPVRLTLIRSGAVIRRVAGETPIRETVIDTEAPDGQPVSYRLEAKAEGELLSNPIFVKPVNREP